MALDPATRATMLAAVPRLRAFALALCRNPDRADTFRPGTNMSAWLTTILRNRFYSEHRRRWREVEDVGGAQAATLMKLPSIKSPADFFDDPIPQAVIIAAEHRRTHHAV